MPVFFLVKKTFGNLKNPNRCIYLRTGLPGYIFYLTILLRSSGKKLTNYTLVQFTFSCLNNIVFNPVVNIFHFKCFLKETVDVATIYL